MQCPSDQVSMWEKVHLVGKEKGFGESSTSEGRRGRGEKELGVCRFAGGVGGAWICPKKGSGMGLGLRKMSLV